MEIIDLKLKTGNATQVYTLKAKTQIQRGCKGEMHIDVNDLSNM